MRPFGAAMAEADETLRRIEEVRRRFERTEVTGHSGNNGSARRWGTAVSSLRWLSIRGYSSGSLRRRSGGFVSEAVNDALRRLNEANDALWALEKSIPYQLSVTKP